MYVFGHFSTDFSHLKHVEMQFVHEILHSVHDRFCTYFAQR